MTKLLIMAGLLVGMGAVSQAQDANIAAPAAANETGISTPMVEPSTATAKPQAAKKKAAKKKAAPVTPKASEVPSAPSSPATDGVPATPEPAATPQ